MLGKRKKLCDKDKIMGLLTIVYPNLATDHMCDACSCVTSSIAPKNSSSSSLGP